MPNPNPLLSALVGQPQGKETIYTAKPLKNFPMTMGAGAFVPASNAFGLRLLSTLKSERRERRRFPVAAPVAREVQRRRRSTAMAAGNPRPAR